MLHVLEFFLILLIVQFADSCLFRPRTEETPRTLSSGSKSTPPPPTPVITHPGCGHSKYYHVADVPGIGIVGGENVRPNQYPWLVRLKIFSGGTYSLCSASIINNLWLITAAHCIDGSSPRDVTIYLADYDRTSVDVLEQRRKVVNITKHHNYSTSNQDYDFALLKLSNYISFLNWEVQPICLPESCADGCGTGTPSYIAGWGTLSEDNGVAPKIMQTGLVEIVDQATCNHYYSTYAFRELTNRMMCAGINGGGGVDTCSGDSGGPLMTMEDGYYKLCGITSFGNGCGRANYPGVYSRVCTVIDWIKATTAMPEP